MSRVFMFFLLVIAWLIPVSEAFAFGPGLRSTSSVTRSMRQQIRHALKPVLYINEAEKDPFNQVVLADSERYIATFQASSIILWDMRFGQPVIREKLDSGTVDQAVLSDDGNYLLVLDGTGKAVEYQLTEDGFYKRHGLSATALSAIAKLKGSPSWVMADVSGKVRVLKAGQDTSARTLFSAPQQICCIAQAGEEAVLLAYGNQLKMVDVLSGAELFSTRTQAAIKSLYPTANGNSFLVFTETELVVLDKNFKTRWIKTFDSQKNVIIGVYDNVLYASSDENSFISYDLFSGQRKTFSLQAEIRFKTKTAKIMSSGFAIILGTDGIAYAVDLVRRKLLMKWIVTNEGWAVVDDQGRFEGDMGGIREIAWSVAKRKLNMTGFSENYFEPGLLKQVAKFNESSFLNKSSPRIEDGIYPPPEVMVTAGDRRSGNLEITVTAKSYSAEDMDDIKEVFLYHNGKRVPVEKRTGHKKDAFENKISWTYLLPLTAGENEFNASVSAWEGIKGLSDKLMVAGAQSKADSASLAITSVGINQYQNKALLLNYAVADARSVAEVFSGDVSSASEEKIKTLLLDADASGKSLRQQLEKLSMLDSNDTAVLFLSGHGVAIEGKWYFLPQEAKSLESASHVKKIGLSGDELADAIIKAPVQKVLLAVDACQSGAVLGSFKTFLQRKALQNVSENTGVHILTATRADQLAPEYRQLKHGLFTYTLLKGLEKKKGRYFADKWPADGKLTVSEIKRYVIKNAPILAKHLAMKNQFTSSEKGGGDIGVLVSPVQLSSGNDFILNELNR